MAGLSKRARRILGEETPRPVASSQDLDVEPVEALIALLLERKDAGVSLAELVTYPEWVVRAVEARGYALDLRGGRLLVSRDPKQVGLAVECAEGVFPSERAVHRCTFISDSHFGGRSAQPAFVRWVLEESERRKSEAIFHCGDMQDGSPRMHAGMLYELVLRSAHEQVDYSAQVLRESQVPIYGVGGNHPGSWFKDAGLDTGRMLAEQLDNYTNLGPISGWVQGPNGDPNFLMLHHPQDGSSYAISYKPQKLAEYLVLENRRVPTGMCAIGHYHKRGWFTGPNGAMMLMVPATCGSTPFMEGKKLVNEAGAYFVEFSIDRHGKIDRFILEHKALWPEEWRPCDYSDFIRHRRPDASSPWVS